LRVLKDGGACDSFGGDLIEMIGDDETGFGGHRRSFG